MQNTCQEDSIIKKNRNQSLLQSKEANYGNIKMKNRRKSHLKKEKWSIKYTYTVDVKKYDCIKLTVM